MTEIRVTNEDLPQYVFPVRPMDPTVEPFTFTLVQGKENEVWLPLWLIVDADGIPIGKIEADSFDGLSAEAISKAATQYVFEMHELAEEGMQIELEPIAVKGLG